MSRALLLGVLCTAAVSPGIAQYRFEVQPFVGYKIGGELPLDRYQPWATYVEFKDSIAAGITIGYNVSNAFGVEFLWSRQPTTVTGFDYGDVFLHRMDAKLDQFHGNMIYSLRHSEDRLRPFILVGADPGRRRTRV